MFAGHLLTKKRLDSAYAHYCPKCGLASPSAAGTDINLSALLERAINSAHKGSADKVRQQLGNAYAANISEAVKEGYGKSIFSTSFGTPDWEMIHNLQNNVYHFSFAKSYQQLQAVTRALYDTDGKIVPFNEFKEIASRINNEFATRYLNVEYNTAIGSSQMAGRWVQFQEDKKDFPFLTYQTVGDARVRPSHQVLDNVTRPVDDAFWQTYYPPNGWLCRCDVIQSIGRKATAPETIEEPDDVPKLFKTNTAANGLVFPEGHPYYEHLPNEVQQAANGRNPFSYEKVHTGKSGGYVYNNPLSNASAHELETAKMLADSGDKVIMLPEINANTEWEKQLRKLALPDKVSKGTMNPDARINDDIVELKTASNVKAFNNLISTKHPQSRIVCIRLLSKAKDADIKRTLKGKLKHDKEGKISEVWILKKGNKKVNKYTAEQIRNFFK